MRSPGRSPPVTGRSVFDPTVGTGGGGPVRVVRPTLQGIPWVVLSKLAGPQLETQVTSARGWRSG